MLEPCVELAVGAAMMRANRESPQFAVKNPKEKSSPTFDLKVSQ
jgi:hypothetical protein